MINAKVVSLILLLVFAVEVASATVQQERVVIASHFRKSTPEEIEVRESIAPLQDWLRKVAFSTEYTERTPSLIDPVYVAQKNIPPQSNPRFKKVTSSLSIYCKVKEEGTMYDFRVLIPSGGVFVKSGVLRFLGGLSFLFDTINKFKSLNNVSQ